MFLDKTKSEHNHSLQNNFENATKIIFLLFFVVLGGYFRFYNLNWDNGYTFHPDERNIDAAVSRINLFDSLDPEFFAYGGLPVYLYRATAQPISIFLEDESWIHDWGKINQIGRFYSALFSTVSLFIIFLLSKKLFGERTAFIALALSTFTPSFIQTAHFGVTESLITLIGVSICLATLKTLELPKYRQFIKIGLLLGIAVAAKTSALSFFIMPATLTTTSLLKKPILSKQSFSAIKKTVVLAIVALVVFTLLSPYTFLNWEKFSESMRYESGVVFGTLQVPYTLQFQGTTSYIYQIKNMLFQAGPSVIFSLIAMVVLLGKTIKEKNRFLIIFLSFPIVYFVYVGSWYTKFIRYMVPVLPFFIISAAYLFNLIYTKQKLIGIFTIIVTVTFSIFWGLAFFSIYQRPQTRIVASSWVYQYIPRGSKILTEHWDDGLPVNIENLSSKRSDYDIEQLTIYEPDNQEKINYYAEKLSQADYIIINSKRLYGTLINLPEQYPITSHYYTQLFDGRLGYTKVGQFTSYPSIFNIQIVDDDAEETFQVYDHPKVIIFKNSQNFTRGILRELLTV